MWQTPNISSYVTIIHFHFATANHTIGSLRRHTLICCCCCCCCLSFFRISHAWHRNLTKHMIYMDSTLETWQGHLWDHRCSISPHRHLPSRRTVTFSCPSFHTRQKELICLQLLWCDAYRKTSRWKSTSDGQPARRCAHRSRCRLTMPGCPACGSRSSD